jgi:hypothetical protein
MTHSESEEDVVDEKTPERKTFAELELLEKEITGI